MATSSSSQAVGKVALVLACGLLGAADPAPPRVVLPEVPRHYPHIRIVMLAYYGNPMGAFEDELLAKSVDLVVPEAHFLKHIHDVAPKTPQLLYSNASSLYGDLLLDWLTYADAKGVSREAAFFHAAKPAPFRGDSPSSRPVTWFWRVERVGERVRDLTDAAHGKEAGLTFGAADETLTAGYPERFREINVELTSGAAGGWSAILEYPSALDAAGRPTWSPLDGRADTTDGLTRSGRLEFDPPADWKPVGAPPLFTVRFRTATAGRPPVAKSLLGRDYVGAGGKNEGVVPVFDTDADRNRDGYLDDAEYARRAAGKDARFAYESRMPCENYGQMRLCTNPGRAEFRAWAVDYHVRFLARQPLAGGLFMDNSEGRIYLKPGDTLEKVESFGADYGALLGEVSKALAPRWVLANIAGGMKHADPVVRANPIYFDEFTIRPLGHNYEQFEDVATEVARRAALTSPPPYAVLDSYSQNGSPTDPRTQLATLAYYYLLADPDATFLMFDGGHEPSSEWRRHWCAAVAHDVGRPSGAWRRIAEGTDPANAARKYRVYRRAYEKVVVVYKPLSHTPNDWKTKASVGDETATSHDLGEAYRPLRADGSLGEAVTRVTLRNGEGAILVRGR